MADVPIRGIEFEIKGNAEEASDGLNTLIGTMRKFQKVGESTKRSANGIGKFLASIKRIMMYRAIRTALRQIGDAFKTGVNNFYQYNKLIGGEFSNNMDSAATSVLYFKNSIGSLVAPLLNSLIPAFNAVIDKAVEFINTLSYAFAYLGGEDVYYKATRSAVEYAEAATEAAGATKKFLLGIDELNVLDSGGGGGAGGKAQDFGSMFKEVPLDEGLASDFLITLKDVLFKWDDMTPELIASKALTAIFGVAGAIIGWHFGGVAGAAIGLVLGASFGILLSNVIFNGDGLISKTEITKLALIAVFGVAGGIIGWRLGGGVFGAAVGLTIGASLGLLIGHLEVKSESQTTAIEFLTALSNAVASAGLAYIGLKIGGPTGAIVGFAIGAAVTLLIQSLSMKSSVGSVTQFYQTEFGKELADLKSRIEQQNQLNLELSARIEGINGNIDAETLANLTLAQQLISEIFSIDENANLTGPQIEELKLKIETLNSLGLEGLQLSFDEATGHVAQTKEEVQGVMDALLEQYRIEAMRDAYIESYKSQFEATQNLTTANENLNDALSKYDEAAVKAKESADKFADAQKALDDAMSMPQLQGVVEDFSDLQQNVYLAGIELKNSNTALAETKQVVADAKESLSDAVEVYENATGKVKEITDAFSDLVSEMSNSAAPALEDGKNVMAGFGDGISEGASSAKSAMEEACALILEAEQKFNEVNSPSVVYENEGKFLMEGLKNGIINNADIVITEIETLADTMISTLSTKLENGWKEIQKWWSGLTLEPFNIKLPHFTMSGTFDVETGKVPTVGVKWYGSGGFPDVGEMFIAREAGPELVGSIGNKTAVLNNSQIVDQVSNGVAEANEEVVKELQEQNALLRAILAKTGVYIDSREITKSQNRYARAMGV